MFRTLILSFLLTFFPLSNGVAAVVDRTQVESSLRVSGFITIDTSGLVVGHEIDANANLSPAMLAFIGQTVDRWRFEPVEVGGHVVNARVPMGLRLVLKPTSDGNYSARIASTWFGSNDSKEQSAGSEPNAVSLSPPRYPLEAQRMGWTGIVYLYVRFGRDGKVTQVYARQVNLRVLGTAAQMDRLRTLFAEAAIRAARGWEFAPPTSGEDAGKEEWSVFVPVDFRMRDEVIPRSGGWETYVPGPIKRPPGLPADGLAEGSPDALPDSGVFSAEQGARLLTPPSA